MDFNNIDKLIEDVWLYLTNHPESTHYRISRKAFREELKAMAITVREYAKAQGIWISLEDELPPPNKEVFWYDAMFNQIYVFGLPDPSKHDADFTHWTPMFRVPLKYKANFRDEDVTFFNHLVTKEQCERMIRKFDLMNKYQKNNNDTESI